MGKGKNKAWDKLNVYDQMKQARKMADQFGVDESKYNMTSSGGRPGEHQERGDINDFRDAIAQAASNDYDVRRTLEAATMAGNKKAKNIGGINNIADAYQAHKFMKKTHHKRMENGGSFHGNNDQLGVTNYWVEKDRDKMLSSYATTRDLNRMKKQLQKAAAANKDAQEDASNPVEPSDRLAQAQSRIGEAAHDPTSLYDKNNSDAPVADDQADAARNFLFEYKDDVNKGASLRNDIQTNIANASNAVTNIYGR